MAALTTAAMPELERVTEEWVKWVSPRPMTFAEFLERFGEDDDVELIDGVAVEKMAAQLDHEKLFAWLFRLLGDFVEARDLGMVLGSRTAVQINPFRGRLPDMLFVRKERLEIVQQKAVFGAPDLVVEFVSPDDRPSDIIARETDYRAIGVAEIWLLDQARRRVRTLRKRDDGYEEAEQSGGTLVSETAPGFQVEVEWLWTDPRPLLRPLLDGLLDEA
jgi:Uma2 family endonuclease